MMIGEVITKDDRKGRNARSARRTTSAVCCQQRQHRRDVSLCGWRLRYNFSCLTQCMRRLKVVVVVVASKIALNAKCIK